MEIRTIEAVGKGKVRVRLEGEQAFLLYKKEAAIYDLTEGGALSMEIWQEIKEEILIKRAKKRAMYLLQKKDYTEKQLYDKLKANEYPQDIIESALAYVKSFHYVDDERYAANYVRCNQDSKSILQMKMELQKKGIDREVLASVLEEEVQVSQEAVIMKYLQKKHYDPDVADEGERRKVYQFLLRKGFQSRDILRCMNVSEFA